MVFWRCFKNVSRPYASKLKNVIILFMNSLIKKITIIAISFMILMAGVFCYQGMQPMNPHCSVDMNHTSVWCSDFISHGTIISSAIITTFATILSILVVLISIRPLFALLTKIKQAVTQITKIKDKIPILSPIQIAISNGIVHPRIP